MIGLLYLDIEVVARGAQNPVAEDKSDVLINYTGSISAL